MLVLRNIIRSFGSISGAFFRCVFIIHEHQRSVGRLDTISIALLLVVPSSLLSLHTPGTQCRTSVQLDWFRQDDLPRIGHRVLTSRQDFDRPSWRGVQLHSTCSNEPRISDVLSIHDKWCLTHGLRMIIRTFKSIPFTFF